jgi:hypothetical protein
MMAALGSALIRSNRLISLQLMHTLVLHARKIALKSEW